MERGESRFEYIGDGITHQRGPPFVRALFSYQNCKRVLIQP